MKIKKVTRSYIEIDDNYWMRDGKSVSFENSYDSNNQVGHPLGAGDRYTEKYNGHIESNKTIKGDYSREEFSYASGSKTYKATIQGTFSLIRN